MKSPTRLIALLRGINVGGRNIIPMAELRVLCGMLGWSEVASYIQSGNLVFIAPGSPARLEGQLEEAIEKKFGCSVSVVVRTSRQWSGYVQANPFANISQAEPSHVLLALSKDTPRADAVEGLLERATFGERVAQTGDVLWIHYCGGIGRSKLSPALLDRLVGSPVTARNWTTVLKLQALALGPG